MRVHIENEWYKNSFAVWVFAEYEPRLLRVTSEGESWEEVEEGSLPEPTLRLRQEVFEAIAVEMGHHTQASNATVEALRDTREVRDRLLTLVEKKA